MIDHAEYAALVVQQRLEVEVLTGMSRDLRAESDRVRDAAERRRAAALARLCGIETD